MTKPNSSGSQTDRIARCFKGLAPAFLALASRTLADQSIGIEDAEDIGQSALVDAMAALPSFRGESAAELTAWFRVILHHRTVSFVRSDQRRFRREGAALDGQDPISAAAMDPKIISEELAERFRTAVNRLSPRQKVAIQWYFFDGNDFGAIARKLGISGDAARKVKSRAIICLRDILARGV